MKKWKLPSNRNEECFCFSSDTAEKRKSETDIRSIEKIPNRKANRKITEKKQYNVQELWDNRKKV